MPEACPDDAILNRHLPDADPNTREEARRALWRLAELILEVQKRLARSNPQVEIRANRAGELDSDLSKPP